jgi:hypothetical protein
MATLTLSTLPEGAVSATLNGMDWAKRCQCSPDCPKVVSPSRTYAYGHSPARAMKVAKQLAQPPARGVSYEDKANTTSLDYQMAKRRAQVESKQVEEMIDAADDGLERARQEVALLQSEKDKLVNRHAHLQALIECTDVLTEQERGNP